MRNKIITALLALAFAMPGIAYSKPAHAGGPIYECWDGSKVKNPKKCPVYKIPVVCPDGKVVSEAKLCYTDPIICPDAGCIWPPPEVVE